ncbi:hypothetical protein SAMN05216302_102322 [Nitrosomonas aestuarii]|uniref:Proline-rich region n=1 Tax=Nitrosomonas aestuarii TaxID=52441 RepID=A0A1I4DWY8_9PROT|nr:hypothetical protein [Nitrosomonas aestuarii]SFK96757.1 hypothetical protein SAMN05216302_102322 [Nitrosomonas aestuarii]
MKKLTGTLLILALLVLAAHNSAWARGGSVGGSSISGGDSGGGGHFRGGGGGSHFGGGRRHLGGGHGHFGHGHSHNRFNFGFNFGGFYGPGYYGSGFYSYPYRYGYRSPYYYPRAYAYPSPVIIPRTPPVYIQRETPVTASTQPQTNYWHYCRNPEGYYPYIKQCPEGWLQVAPQPTPR